MKRECPVCQGYGAVHCVRCERCGGKGRVPCSAARVYCRLFRRGWLMVINGPYLAIRADDRNPPTEKAFLALVDHADSLWRMLNGPPAAGMYQPAYLERVN